MTTLTFPATLDYQAEWAGHARCGAEMIVGYYVLQMIDADGHILTEPKVLARYEDGSSYSDALEFARIYRQGKGWAVVATRYECGHSLW